MAQVTIFDKHGLTEKVIKLSATNSSREIAKILEEEDKVKISYVTITKFVKEIRQDRAEATKEVIAQTVTPGLTSDLAFFDEMLIKYRDMFMLISDPEDLARIGKEYRATVESKIKIAGGNSPEEDLRKAYININIDDM